MSEDKTLQKCNFCYSCDELNTEEIPFWSKKSGNYSPYPKMVTCEEQYNLSNESLKEVEPELDDKSLEFTLSLGDSYKDKWVFYWAPNSTDDIHTIHPPEKAYNKYENHGLKQCDKYGDVVLRFNRPQPYKDDKQTYCRHVHYIAEGPDKTWLTLKTIRVICTIPIEELDELIKSEQCVIMNALPAEYFEKEKIPKSVNLPYQSLDKLTQKSKERKVLKFLKAKVKSDYPELHDKVRQKKLSIKDVPIVTYCAHSKCTASEQLINHLFDCKINNTLEWKEGMEGWNKKRTFFGEGDLKEPEPEPDIESPEVIKEKKEDKKEDDKLEEDKLEDDKLEEDKLEDDKLEEDGGEDDEDEDDDDDGDDDEDDEDLEDSDDEDEDELEEDSDDSDDELITIQHEGVEYDIQDDILYDTYLDPIGKVKVVDGKIVEMDKAVQDYHETMKPKKEKKEEEKKEKKEDKKESKGDYNRYNLQISKGELKDIVKQIANREKNTYSYGNLKNMSRKELLKIVKICQGKKFKVSTKTDYKYKTEKEIDQLSETELRETINEMIGREPGTYKYTESSWTKERLVDFILTCQDVTVPRKKGGANLFVGGGWCL